MKRTLRIAGALTSHLIVKSLQFERSDPGDRLFIGGNRSDWSKGLGADTRRTGGLGLSNDSRSCQERMWEETMPAGNKWRLSGDY